MAAGEALIFNGGLLHGSGPNKSAEGRLAASCVLVPQEAPILLSVPISATQVEIFEVDETFFLANDLGSRPVGAKSLGVVEYEKIAQFAEVGVLQSPYLRPEHPVSPNWHLWINSWTGRKQ